MGLHQSIFIRIVVIFLILIFNQLEIHNIWSNIVSNIIHIEQTLFSCLNNAFHMRVMPIYLFYFLLYQNDEHIVVVNKTCCVLVCVVVVDFE